MSCSCAVGRIVPLVVFPYPASIDIYVVALSVFRLLSGRLLPSDGEFSKAFVGFLNIPWAMREFERRTDQEAMLAVCSMRLMPLSNFSRSINLGDSLSPSGRRQFSMAFPIISTVSTTARGTALLLMVRSFRLGDSDRLFTRSICQRLQSVVTQFSPWSTYDSSAAPDLSREFKASDAMTCHASALSYLYFS